MAIIPFLSDQASDFYNDEPGGPDPAGTIDWLEPKVLESNEGRTTPNGPIYDTGARGFHMLPQSNLLVAVRNLLSTSISGVTSRVFYTVHNTALEQLAITYLDTAVSPFTLAPVDTSAEPWVRGSARRIVVPGDTERGSNPLGLAAMDIDTGQFVTGFARAQLLANIPNFNVNAGSGPMLVSPDGETLIYSNPSYYKIGLTSEGLFNDLTHLPTASGEALAVSNNALYTFSLTSGYATSISRRNLTTGALEGSIAPPSGFNRFYRLSHTSARVSGGYLYLICAFAGASNAQQYVVKISRTTDQVVATWAIPNPAASGNFTKSSSFSWTSMSFDSIGRLWLADAGDQYTVNLGSGMYRRYQRIHLAELS